MQSAYEILSDILRDNDAEIHRTTPGGYADGLAAAGARIRARMAGMPRSSGGSPWPGGGGGGHGPDWPVSPAPNHPPPGRVIEAEAQYNTASQRQPIPARLTSGE